jgi:hypothetical protein
MMVCYFWLWHRLIGLARIAEELFAGLPRDTTVEEEHILAMWKMFFRIQGNNIVELIWGLATRQNQSPDQAYVNMDHVAMG